MSGNKFYWGEPDEGTLTLGVVYHILKRNEINAATGFHPIGYVIDDPSVNEEEDPDGNQT